MGKKTGTKLHATEVKASETTEEVVTPVSINTSSVQDAINLGLATLQEGKTKADAARIIYTQIKGETKEVIVSAFVVGATLTPKGALTYWYNCRRRDMKPA